MSDGSVNILGVHRAAPGTLAAGEKAQATLTDDARLRVDASGGTAPIVVRFSTPDSFDSGAALVGEGAILAAPGTLVDVQVYNASTGTIFLQLFNTVAPPANGTAPVTVPVEVPPSANATITFAAGQGRAFSTGISFAASSTLLTKTTVAASVVVNAQYFP